MGKKGAEWNILLMMLLGIGFLLVIIGMIVITKQGSENVFAQLMEKIRFG